jgi:hypothetical protein
MLHVRTLYSALHNNVKGICALHQSALTALRK